MSLRRALLHSSVALFVLACGPDPRGDDDVIDDADAAPTADARPPVADAGPDEYIVYVHTRDTLYRMDPVSFELTLVGGFAIADGDLITDLAVTPDGTIYGISNTKLYTIDGTTGVATFVAPMASMDNVGLTFLPDGTLLATDETGGVRKVNPQNGQVMEIGAFGGGFATAGDLVATADGTMYAISDKGPVGNEFMSNWLLTVNTTNGAAVGVGQIGYGQVFGAAFVNEKVYAFTKAGQVVQIDPTTGAGTLVKTHAIEFWGAGVTPLVPGVE